jgi:PAS domain S-box-containing protein
MKAVDVYSAAVGGPQAELLDAVPDGLLAFDASLRVTAWNAATAQATGVGREQAIGRPLEDVLPSLRGTGGEQALRRVLSGEVVDAREQCWMPPGAEPARWFDVRCRPLRDASGDVVGGLVIATDVTADHDSRDASARERRLLRTLIDSAPFGMLAVDRDMRITAWNVWAERFTHRRRGDVVGRHLLEELPDLAGTDVQRDYERALAGETVQVRDRWYGQPGGEQRCWDVVFAPMCDGDGAVTGAVMIAIDMTDRARADRAQRDDRAFLRTLVDASPASIVAFDRDLRQTEWNHRAERNTGIRRADAIGRTSEELFPGFIGSPWHALVERVLEGEAMQGLDYALNDPATGRPIELDVTMAPLRDALGAIVGALVMSVDVTERVRVQRALEESEARYRELFEQSAVAQLLVDTGTRTVTAANAAAATLFELPREALVGTPVARLREDDTAPDGPAVPAGRHAYRSASGARLVIDAYATVVRRDDRELVHATLVDMTARVQAEAERDRLIRIVEASADLVATANPVTRMITYINPAGRALLGVGASDEISIEQIIVDEDRALAFEEALPRTLREGSWRGEVRLRARDGHVVTTSVVVVAHHDARGVAEFVSGIVRDVSFEKRREAELATARDVAERASRAKSAFLAGLSHELRTPLGAVIGFTQLLRDSTNPPLTATQREYLTDVLTGAQQMHAIVDDALDLARVEAGVIDIRPRPIDLGQLVDEALATVAPLAAQRGVRLEREVADDAAQIVADPARVRQVLLNYLTNAIKFNVAAGRARVEVTGAGDYVQLTVRDTGRGIAAEDLPRLFVEFQRLGERDVAGTGLGLAITRRIVEAMGGSTGATSEPGVGSAFHATLPRLYRPVPAGEAPSPHASLGNHPPS